MSRLPPGTIKNPKFYVITFDGETKNLFDWRDAGVIDLHRDKWFDYWEYQVVSTGEIVSFQQWLRPSDHSEWYRAALEKQQQDMTDTKGVDKSSPFETNTNKEVTK